MSEEMITARQALKLASDILNTDSARLEARVILSFVLSCEQAYLAAHDDVILTAGQKDKFFELTLRRRRREPIAYILNNKEFYGRNFYVDQRVLIPRPETEHLIDRSLQMISHIKAPKILDLCCGSGCIGVTLAAERPDLKVYFSDISESALKVAEMNLRTLLNKDAVFICSDLFENINIRDFDLIAANPPYISDDEMNLLDKDLSYEPDSALRGGKNGTDFYRKIIKKARAFLKPGAALVFEIGFSQASEITELMENCGFSKIITDKDYSGNDRIISAVTKLA